VPDSPRLRLSILGIVAFSLFAALLARLWYLQVLVSDEFKVKAVQNQVELVSEPAPRGRILDREGRVLVDNQASNVIAIERLQLEQLSDTERTDLVAHLAAILGQPVEAIEARIADTSLSPYTPVPIAEGVDERLMVLVRERRDILPGVVANRVATRAYPYGSLAAHVLGYVGEVNSDELARKPDVYSLGDTIGKSGVELTYESALRGVDGEQRIEVDAQGRPLRVISRTPPKQGNDVVLSINLDVQRVAEESLAQGLEAAQQQKFEDDGKPLVANAGASVVLDMKEGTVAAMASYPTFDLPGLANGVSADEAAVLFPKDQTAAAPFVNRAITGLYAPGSTWKLVTGDAALRSGLITGNTSYNDTGEYIISDCTDSGCIKRNPGGTPYGRLNVAKAMMVSSDVFFYKLGADFWAQRDKYGENTIQDVASMLGFGASTGVPLPSEQNGRVLPKKLKSELHQQNPRLVSDGWFTGNNVNLAIGQEAMLVTPIQLANAYATYANLGVRNSPNLALRVQDQEGNVIEEIGRRQVAQIDLPANVTGPLLQGFAGVVSDPSGTAHNAFAGFPLREYPIAGKTGTAQATPKQDTALFVGYGPTTDPRYAVAVVMEQSGFGGQAAAPVARRIFGVLSGLELAGAVSTVSGVGD
jgi:penicillin-binding protein 2